MKKTFLAASIATVITMPIVAYAADETADGDKIERVVVTGSNISRINKEGPTAVEIIKRSDIEKTGASTVVELLGKIPSVSVQLDGNDKASFAPGAASVGLRGLDPKYTLILLNGRRLANYGFADGAENSFVDLNNLPLAAIDSIEILRDGASAIYGSDAVAGVINFKTRRNYQGIEATTNLGANEKGDGRTADASVTAGWGDLDKDGKNLLVTLDAFNSSPLLSQKHKATADRDFRRFGGSDARSTSDYLGSLKDYDTGEGFPIPGCRGIVDIDSTGNPACLTNQKVQLSPSNQRIGLSGIYTIQINATDELFTELGFNHNKTITQRGFPTFDSTFLGSTEGSTNPGLAGLPGPSEDGTLAGFTPGDILRVSRNIYEASHLTDVTTSNTLRLVTGWRGTIGKWDSELGFSFNQNKLSSETSNAVLKDVSAQSLQDGLLGNGGYDPFVYANPTSVVDPMLTTTQRIAVSRLSSIDWKMSTPELFTLNSAPVGFAWGLQASHETINDSPDAKEEAGNIAGSGATASKAGRSLYSIYGELNIPVLKQLEAQFALRDDYYSDFGNAFNPKLAFAWRPMKEVLVRASATTSFKAPTLPEIASTAAGYNVVADFARCGPLGYIGPNCAYSIRQYTQGNPDLKAEKANNYSFGFVVQPIKDLSASLDWYMINQRNTIQAEDPQFILDHEDSSPEFAALIGRDPRNPGLEARYPGLNKGRIKSITTPYVNVGKTDTQGLDLDLKYVLSLGQYGKLNLREVNSYTLTFKQSTTPGEQPVSRLDSIYHPKWKNTFRIGYEYSASELAFTARTSAGTKNITDPTYNQDPEITDARIPSYTVWDMNYNFKATDHLTLNFGVNNLFDKSPVYGSTTYLDDFITPLNDHVGRYYYANMRYKF
ncbi:TonB-dependent receptor [Aquirhabdus parva]|uniref:TonB-dependent receptor n=1 Tax=Aquirhabdus parva TaxID=2283318 RepID=A0A345PAJ3_9GAMM|nr:TonB-dependent receptor [Aquirhabdus parva]AXI04302.1 TonB-dependent receptor [Aquirhabdus parva]